MSNENNIVSFIIFVSLKELKAFCDVMTKN